VGGVDDEVVSLHERKELLHRLEHGLAGVAFAEKTALGQESLGDVAG
jgi:hypothetical protein